MNRFSLWIAHDGQLHDPCPVTEPRRDQSPQTLAARVARSAGWIVGGRLVMGLFGFLNTIIIARLLAPEDFGIVAIGLTTMQILINVTDFGVSQAVIRFRDADREDLDTLFTLSALRGALIALGLAAVAPFAASFYGDPRVFWVFVGVALYPFVSGFINPRFYEFERLLDYSKEFMAAVANKLAGVAVSIAIAVIFRSYWAILLGLATNAVVQLALSYLMRPYAPRFSFASLKRILGFSGWLTGVGLMSALNNKLDPLILARAVGVAGAGHYFMGLQLAELPTREIAFPATRAIYPGLAELQADPARANQAFLKGVEAMAAIATPAAIGFALVARDLIPLLIGEKWGEAATVVEIITPIMGVQMPLLATQYYAMAVGSTRYVFLRELVFFLIRTPVFIWAALTHGLLGAAYAVAACGVVHILLNLGLYARTSDDSMFRPVWRARRSAAAALVMSAALLGLRAAGAMADWGPLLRLVSEVVIGAAVYVAAHAGLWRLERRPDGVERLLISIVRPILLRLVRSSP